jgi:ribosomal protein S15P/S13E
MTPEEQSIHLVGQLAKLERELQETHSDLEFRRGLYKLQAERVERLERNLEQEHQDRKQAELDVCRALGERNDARAELASLKATIADPDEVELAMIRGEIAIPDRAEFDAVRETPVGYNPSPIADEIDASRKDGKRDKSG